MASIEIDGKKVEVRQGQMIIEAADELGINIPRFCYHKKLSIAANCRMCLVDVANAPKPLPACATPVTDGMKVFTTSQRATDAQKAVMEFLLINHPLDCPICDQGGQCELQDVALVYGKSASRYAEPKRAVKDKNLGSLISTDMTRCIHCTRCVRFGSEIAGVREMGATGRGEFMEIGTYVEQSIDSELSGNIIDLCPVGALTSKPFRFKARAWELKSLPSISPHDCVGSHLFFHTFRGKVYRTLPRENEQLNEVWLSDRDRFSYEAFNHPSRLDKPYVKRNGQWHAVEWIDALQVTVEKIKQAIASAGPHQIGVLASSSCSLEEFYLLQKLFRHLHCQNIDHRLRQLDFSHQSFCGMAPTLGIHLDQLEQQDAIVIIGSDVRKEQPIIAHRIRKASLNGTHIYAINPLQGDFHFECTAQLIAEDADVAQPLLKVINAVLSFKPDLKAHCPTLPFDSNAISDEVRIFAEKLLQQEKVSLVLGSYAITHPHAGYIYYLSRLLASLLEATWGEMSFGTNSAGAWIAGAIPHRLPFGQVNVAKGHHALEMFQQKLNTYVLLQCEPEYDCATSHLAHQALKDAHSVIVLSPFDNPHYREYADVLLPVTPMSEMPGTYINACHEWQSFQAAVLPWADSRPAWKVLRVLANLLKIPDFNYEHHGEVLNEIEKQYEAQSFFTDTLLTMPLSKSAIPKKVDGQLLRLAPVSLYDVDNMTRRATSLQNTKDALLARCVRINSQEALSRRLQQHAKVAVHQNGQTTHEPLTVEIDDKVPNGIAVVASGLELTRSLGAPFGFIELNPIEEAK